MVSPEPQAIPIVTEHEPTYARAYQRAGIAALLVGAAALIFACAVLIWVLWTMLAPVTATPFDADGVRCYHRAAENACLKTAEPPR